MPIFDPEIGGPYPGIKLDDHFQWHGKDLGCADKALYETSASEFLTKPRTPTILQCQRKGGDIVRYDTATEEFGVLGWNGYIRTYFIAVPNDGTWFRGRMDMHPHATNLEYYRENCKRH